MKSVVSWELAVDSWQLTVDSCYIIFGRLTVIPVGAGSPAIVAKNRPAQKPAPTMYDARSIGHDISC